MSSNQICRMCGQEDEYCDCDSFAEWLTSKPFAFKDKEPCNTKKDEEYDMLHEEPKESFIKRWNDKCKEKVDEANYIKMAEANGEALVRLDGDSFKGNDTSIKIDDTITRVEFDNLNTMYKEILKTVVKLDKNIGDRVEKLENDVKGLSNSETILQMFVVFSSLVYLFRNHLPHIW